jgi:uncharacterized membrane protein YgcG
MNWKRLLLIFTVSVALGSIIGCGGDEDEDDDYDYSGGNSGSSGSSGGSGGSDN